MNKSLFWQIIKYGIVGVMNTLLTALVIWLILHFAYRIDDEAKAPTQAMFVANFSGYVIGIINSFLFNRNWTFKNKSDWRLGFLKFILAFVICYSLQLGVVIGLNNLHIIPTINVFGKVFLSAYSCQLIGIVVYTLLNFILNKYYTFREIPMSAINN